ncbi:hypothetical protein OC834_002833 [Tilletia horrida]|uniref:Uncharacterized protein n=1 Tax=Tilletia horrida TaxID=155126 RepID=A0AAN6JJW2_9BASI|nr:hypothetical protein OC835_006883 [Tilletia horrida]KAK0528801.1 hypothetical protein OC842_004443 [Tilletia horrida]KAK0531780.1 hypothetical protein OC834_002833 [Tilletia horrida]KAK0566846.1 hypothetical protein OC844_000523 [Tilletia horrida]
MRTAFSISLLFGALTVLLMGVSVKADYQVDCFLLAQRQKSQIYMECLNCARCREEGYQPQPVQDPSCFLNCGMSSSYGTIVGCKKLCQCKNTRCPQGYGAVPNYTPQPSTGGGASDPAQSPAQPQPGTGSSGGGGGPGQ